MKIKESEQFNQKARKIQKPEKIGSYKEEDCIFLLKCINDLVEEVGTLEREKHMQCGGHYSELLPIEYMPTEEYMTLYREILEDSASEIAYYVGVVAELIYKKKKDQLVIVSLARAGTPIGVLMKRYLKEKYGKDFPHYSISIIRDRGIDVNAISYILSQHEAQGIQFVDGWTGKGVIGDTLKKACKEFGEAYGIELDDSLAVLCDPGECTELYGTRSDYLIPSACLNATVSGLVSRTVLRSDVIGPDDFHGAKYYKEWEAIDVSNDFVDTLSAYFKTLHITEVDLLGKEHGKYNAAQSVENIKVHFGMDSINRVKPGIGETTRVLLRRVPWKILVKDKKDPHLKHILLLAEDRGVEVEEYEDMCYSCCGLIKSLK